MAGTSPLDVQHPPRDCTRTRSVLGGIFPRGYLRAGNATCTRTRQTCKRKLTRVPISRVYQVAFELYRSTTEQTSIDIYLGKKGDLLPTICLGSNGRSRKPLGAHATVTRIVENLVCVVKRVTYPY